MLIGVACAVTACAHAEEAAIASGDLPRVVLQPDDLPRAFTRFDEGRQIGADAPPGATPDRFGRSGGWKARYRRSGSTETRGPLVVESRADLFASADGAAKDLEAMRARLRGGRAVAQPHLGDDAVASMLRQGGVVFFTIGWRYENVTASVSVNGFAGRLSLADAVALARKQQQRIEAAAR